MKITFFLLLQFSIISLGSAQCSAGFKDLSNQNYRVCVDNSDPLRFYLLKKNVNGGDLIVTSVPEFSLSGSIILSDPDGPTLIESSSLGALKGQHGLAYGIINDEIDSFSVEYGKNWDHIFKVGIEEVLDHQDDINDNGEINNVVQDNILYYPAIGNKHFKEKYGFDLPPSNSGGLAPFNDLNNNGKYEPLFGDHPVIKGTEMMLWFSNDYNNTTFGNRTHTSFEFLTILYFDSQNPEFENVINIDLKIITENKEPIIDTYFSLQSNASLTYESVHSHRFTKTGCLPKENINFYFRELTLDIDGDSLGQEDVWFPATIWKYNFPNHFMTSYILYNPSCYIPYLEEPSSDWNFNLDRGIWKDGVPLTWGEDGYEYLKMDTVKYIYDHSDVPEVGYWRHKIPDECFLPYISSSTKGQSGFYLGDIVNGDVFNFNFSIYLALDQEWENPNESDIMDYLDGIPEFKNNEFLLDEQWNLKNFIFPNPVSNTLYFANNSNKIINIEIFDTKGDLKFQWKGSSNNISLNISNLLPGIFFAKITNIDEQTETVSFSKI